MSGKKIIAGMIAIVLFGSSASLSYAHHQKEVLGESTVSSEVEFPAVTAGPGFILPDSPFYFVDQAFQKIRLMTAFTPEQKAEVHSQIAGERLAELRVMYAKNNDKGIATALSELSNESEQAAANLKTADSSGKDVNELSRVVNDRIKMQREVLSKLEDQAGGSMRLKIRLAREELKKAKVQAEDTLDEDEIENEIEDSAEEEMEDVVKDATRSARGLEHAIGVLDRLASQAAMKDQVRREEALRHAIEVKNEALLKQQQKRIEFETKKKERLLEEQKNTTENAREALKKSQEAYNEFRKSKEKIKEIEKEESSDDSSKSE